MARESGGGGARSRGGASRSKRESEAGTFFMATLVMWSISVFFEILFNKRSELAPIIIGFVFFQSANVVVRKFVSRDPLFVNTCVSFLHSSITSASGQLPNSSYELGILVAF